MDIAHNLQAIHASIPPHVKLLCVSKFHPAEAILEAYNAGERCFGESRPQELQQKAPQLPADIEWHFIGNLQTNKVKTVVQHASLIHSVANIRLFDQIEKDAAKIDKIQDVLIELHVADEETKQGFTPQEATSLLTPDFVATHPHIRLRGVMGMASLTDNEAQIHSEFETIRECFNTLKNTVFADKAEFDQISIGMSGDYPIALEHGATIVRIGSAIFGNRNY